MLRELPPGSWATWRVMRSARLEIDAHGLRVRTVGVLSMLLGRRELAMPTARIQFARSLSRAVATESSPRIGLSGLSVPGRCRVGIFGVGPRQVWVTDHRPTLLAIYLRGDTFDRLVVSVDDPDAVAARINTLVGDDAGDRSGAESARRTTPRGVSA